MTPKVGGGVGGWVVNPDRGVSPGALPVVKNALTSLSVFFFFTIP